MCTAIVSTLLVVFLPWSLQAEPVAPRGATGEAAASTDTAMSQGHWKVQVIHLAHAEPDDICKLLLDTLAPADRGSLQASVGTALGTVVLAGYEGTLQRARDLIELFDVNTASEMQPHVFTLRHADAKKLSHRLIRNTGVTSVEAVERTNSLIVTVCSRELDRIARQIESLDVPALETFPTVRRAFVEGAIFEVRMTPEAVVSLDADELTKKAQSVQSLQAALAEMGQTRILCRVHQMAVLDAKPTLQQGANVPFVRAKTASDKGTPTVQVEYEDIGWTLTLGGRWEEGPKDRCTVSVQNELSYLSDSSIELAAGIRAPIFHKLKQSFEGDVASGQPILLISIQSPEGQPAVAFITRLVFEQQE